MRTGEREAAFIFDLLSTDEAGTPLGTFTVRGTVELAGRGEVFDGAYDVVATDPTGQISRAGGGTLAGTRILLEPMGTPSVATPVA